MKLNEIARSWIGTPWRPGQSKKGVSCDCIGLVLGVVNELRPNKPISIENYSQVPHGDYLLRELSKYAVKKINGYDVGDVLVFRINKNITHVGFYDEGDTIIHADNTLGVVKVPLGSWERRVVAAYEMV